MTNDNDTPEFDSSLHPVHEAAEIYPEMSTERRKDLAADIKANGLRHPIVLCMSERHGRLLPFSKVALGMTPAAKQASNPSSRSIKETPKPTSSPSTCGATGATSNAA